MGPLHKPRDELTRQLLRPLVLLLKIHMNLGKEQASTAMSPTTSNGLRRPHAMLLQQRNTTSRGRTTGFAFTRRLRSG